MILSPNASQMVSGLRSLPLKLSGGFSGNLGFPAVAGAHIAMHQPCVILNGVALPATDFKMTLSADDPNTPGEG